VADPGRWRYGYDLCTELGIRAGSMYPILIRLADRGLLETSWEDQRAPGRPARHLYRLSSLSHLTIYLTNAYDIAAYPHSGYPDIASYLLSDAAAGSILAGLVLYPVSWLLLAVLGAAAGSSLRHHTHGPTATSS
jgi:hypothetical protein